MRKSLLKSAQHATTPSVALGNLSPALSPSTGAQKLYLECDIKSARLALAARRSKDALSLVISAMGSRNDETRSVTATLSAQVLWQLGHHALAIDQLTASIGNMPPLGNDAANASEIGTTISLLVSVSVSSSDGLF